MTTTNTALSAQIEKLRIEFQHLLSEVEHLRTEVAGLKTRMDAYEIRLDGNSTMLTRIDEQVKALTGIGKWVVGLLGTLCVSVLAGIIVALITHFF